MKTDTISAVMAELGRRRIAKLSARGRKELASLAGRSSWAKLSEAERSIEMKRRLRLAKKTRAKRILSKLSASSE